MNDSLPREKGSCSSGGRACGREPGGCGPVQQIVTGIPGERMNSERKAAHRQARFTCLVLHRSPQSAASCRCHHRFPNCSVQKNQTPKRTETANLSILYREGTIPGIFFGRHYNWTNWDKIKRLSRHRLPWKPANCPASEKKQGHLFFEKKTAAYR